MYFPAVADLMMINSLYHSEVGAQRSKPKSISGSSGARCQRSSRAPSSKHSLPVVCVCLEIPSKFWERDVTQYCSISSFFKGFPEIKFHLIFSTFDIDIDIYNNRCVFKNRSICMAINYLMEVHLRLDRTIHPLCFISKQHLSENVFYGLSMKKARLPSRIWMDRKPEVMLSSV